MILIAQSLFSPITQNARSRTRARARAIAILFTLRSAKLRRRSPFSGIFFIISATSQLTFCFRMIFLKGLVRLADGLRRTLLRFNAPGDLLRRPGPSLTKAPFLSFWFLLFVP